MDIAAKKLNILEMILSIKDEELLDIINRKIVGALPSADSQVLNGGLLGKYRTEIEPVFDLEKIKKEQGYTGIDKAQMDRLIKEADIQEPLEELLQMI